MYEPSAPFSGRIVAAPDGIDATSAAATTARCSVSTPPASPPSSSTPRSSRSTRWRSHPAAACTSPPRPTAGSTGSMPTARAPSSSTLPTSTSGALARGSRRAACSRPQETRASSTRSRLMARARRSTRRKPRTRCRWRFDRAGRLIAGTESPGRVFRIDASGKPFVLLDSGYNEIHKLRIDQSGAIYAAAVRGRGDKAGAGPRRAGATSSRYLADGRVASVSTEINGDHRHCRCVPGRQSVRSAASPVGPGGRRDLPYHAGRGFGSHLGIARGHAVRHRLRG